MLMRRSWAVYGPEDGGTGAGGGAGPAEGGAPQAPSYVLPAETRPDWLPETFYDPQGKAIRVDALAKSYGELHSKLGQRAEATKAEVLAELRKGVPEKPEGYAVEVPQGLPEGFQPLKPAEEDGMLAVMRQVAHEAGLKPEQFRKLTDGFFAWQAAQMIDTKAEMAKVGEGAEARVQAVGAFLQRHLAEDEWRGVAAMTMTAPGLLGLEKLMKLAERGADGATRSDGGGSAGGGQGITAEEARNLIRDPVYKQNTPEGQAMRDKVLAFFQAGGTIPRT